MNTEEALKIISRYAPCDHPEAEQRGIANLYCPLCHLQFNSRSLPRFKASAKMFEQAIDTLAKEIERLQSLNDTYRSVIQDWL